MEGTNKQEARELRVRARPTNRRQCAFGCVPGEASVERTIKPADPEHGRGCAEKAEAERGALQRAIAS